jgi:hypothetical protein
MPLFSNLRYCLSCAAPLPELRRTLAELHRTISELRCTLAELRSTLSELRRTLSELRRNLSELSRTLSDPGTPHPTELRGSLMSYAPPHLRTPHPNE